MRWLFGHPGECPGDGRSHGYFWKRFVSDASFDILNIRLKNWRGCRRKSIAEKADQVTLGPPFAFRLGWVVGPGQGRCIPVLIQRPALASYVGSRCYQTDSSFIIYPFIICSFPSHGPWWLMRSPALVRASRQSFLKCAILGPSTPSG